MSIKFLLVLLLAVVALITSSLADHHKPPTYPRHKPPAIEVEDGVQLGRGFLPFQHDQNIHVKEGVLTSKTAYERVSENNGIAENAKSRRSLAGGRDPYVDVIDYAPAHATPPIHN
ncbi:hypothetical protein RHMOL_Rhmol01G0043900 [Rhododendron molle]|uniref:Uncharacterized protein n=1 Tax=Rhododendron molle TaxID=49168 RepID=A0ACC0PZW1_RHOML|nr:hypothetical protein RHMOL_Rhmol01G0043900 [Rhododendron molle]